MFGQSGDERGEGGVNSSIAGLEELAERDKFPGPALPGALRRT
ncbi:MULTISPECIES: hypothetical protein [unclassified Streptomyces]|nr:MULTISPECIES: hypothetical protein [unclassified Streptomyces]